MLNELRNEIHELAKSKGWWDEDRSFGDIVALCHSELSEAFEEYRNGCNLYYCDGYKGNLACTEEHDRLDNGVCLECLSLKANARTYKTKPEGIAIELADCIIRILDYCGKEDINIDEAIRIKHEYNKIRPHRHGGKVV